MSAIVRHSACRMVLGLVLASMVFLPGLAAQTCSSGPDLDAASKSAIDAAAKQFLQMSKTGDVAGLRANSIPAIAGDFGAIEQAAITNKPYLAERDSSITGTYLLDASQAKAALARADFYCGIYNSPDRLSFSIPNLPPGKYAIVIQKVNGKDPITLTLILQSMTGAWKLAGYYPRLNAINGHDGQWYVTQARAYKAQGKPLVAWLYYLEAWELTAPVSFMSTPQLDKLADELQSARPASLPSDSAPLSLSANGKTFRVTELAPAAIENKLDVRVTYQNANATDSGAAFQDNMAVIRATLAKYPELREAFDSVIARAVDGNGHEYGSMLLMKDIK